MSFIGNVKKAFGFNDESLGEINGGFLTPIGKTQQTGNQPLHASAPAAPVMPTIKSDEEHAKEMQLAIFNKVVEIFNESLPDFIRKSIDVNAQRQYLYDALDKSLIDYLTNIGIDVSQQYERQWDKERATFQNEMNGLRAQIKEMENSREESKRQQLSAERQKRALTERVHDLEAQLVTLEADKEQYALERKSLINKVNVLNVREREVNELQDEIKQLQDQLLNAGKDENAENALKEMKTKNAEIISQKDAQINDLKQSLEQSQAKERISDEMAKDLNDKTVKAHALIKEKEEELGKTSQELKQAQEKLEAALSDLKAASEIRPQMEKLEKEKEKNDARINQLLAENKQLQQTVESLNQELDMAKLTLPANEERAEIPQEPRAESLPATEPIEEVKPEGQTIKISAIDESFYNDTEWLIATPPTGTPTRPTPLTTENDFGYQEPPRKPAQTDDATQMSLW